MSRLLPLLLLGGMALPAPAVAQKGIRLEVGASAKRQAKRLRVLGR